MSLLFIAAEIFLLAGVKSRQSENTVRLSHIELYSHDPIQMSEKLLRNVSDCKKL